MLGKPRAAHEQRLTKCDMEILDLHVRVAGHATLDRSAKASLLADEALAPLSNSVRARLAANVNPGGSWLSAQVQGTAVFIAEDWVISIHGAKLLDCVSAMCIVLNVVGQQLDALVSIVLLTPLDKNDNRLYSLLDSENRKARLRRVLLWGLTILIGALSGALISQLIGGI